MHIYLNRTGLQTGYKSIYASREKLLHKWRPKLSAAYVRRWNQYAQKLARRESQQAKYRRWLPWIVIGLVFWCGASIWWTGEDFCNGINLAMQAIFCVIAAAVIWNHYTKRPVPPENPLAQDTRKKTISPVKQQLFPDLHLTWREGLRARIPSPYEIELRAEETKQWGLIGEYNLIRELNRVLPTNVFILHSLMQKPKDDLDVVVIGPMGIWYFEVKYYNAEIIWRDNQWTYWQFDHQTKRRKQVNLGQPPHEQWERMRDETRRTLSMRGKDLLRRVPELNKIKGGIVFSHPKAVVTVYEPNPFRCGGISAWVNTMRKAPRMRGMTTEICYQVTDILLKRHQELNPLMRVYSMDAYARQVMRESESKIQNWIADS